MLWNEANIIKLKWEMGIIGDVQHREIKFK